MALIHKCLFKALISGISIYSQVRIQLYQSQSMTALGLKSGKVHKSGLYGHLRELKIKACKDYIWKLYLIQFEISRTYNFQVTGQNM